MPVPLSIAFGLFLAVHAQTAEQPVKTVTLSDGTTVTGHVIDEGQSGYLLRTISGETVRVPYAQVVSVEVTQAPTTSAVPDSTTAPSIEGRYSGAIGDMSVMVADHDVVVSGYEGTYGEGMGIRICQCGVHRGTRKGDVIEVRDVAYGGPPKYITIQGQDLLLGSDWSDCCGMGWNKDQLQRQGPLLTCTITAERSWFSPAPGAPTQAGPYVVTGDRVEILPPPITEDSQAYARFVGPTKTTTGWLQSSTFRCGR